MSNFFLNRKSFAPLRALGKNCAEFFNYLYVSKDGTAATNCEMFVRVSLPSIPLNAEPRIFPADEATELRPKGTEELIQMPTGIEAVTTGKYRVPNYDYILPKQSEVQASITIDGKKLIELLKAATEVSEHSCNLMRISICRDSTCLKIDTHRNDGEQEFVGVMKRLAYNGTKIPNTVMPSKGTPSEKVEQENLTLPITGGRKFRE